MQTVHPTLIKQNKKLAKRFMYISPADLRVGAINLYFENAILQFTSQPFILRKTKLCPWKL